VTSQVLFFVTLNNAFTSMQQTVMIFQQEKQVFVRERSAGS
jgi:hypothetical protein